MQDTITQTEQRAQQAAEQQKQTGANQIDQVAQLAPPTNFNSKCPRPPNSCTRPLPAWAGALRDRSLLDLMGTFNDLGRKEPLAMFGGAVLAGFAISRFLKSSADTKGGGSTS